MELEEGYDVYRFGPKQMRWRAYFKYMAIAAGTIAAGVATEEVIRHRDKIEDNIRERAKRRTKADFVIEKMGHPLRDSEGDKGDKNAAIGRRILAATLIEPPQKTFGMIQDILGIDSMEQTKDAIHALRSLIKHGMIEVQNDQENKNETYAISDPLAGYLSEYGDMGLKLRATALELDPSFTIETHRTRLNDIHAAGVEPIFIGRSDNGEI